MVGRFRVSAFRRFPPFPLTLQGRIGTVNVSVIMRPERAVERRDGRCCVRMCERRLQEVSRFVWEFSPMLMRARFRHVLAALAVLSLFTSTAWCFPDAVELINDFSHYTII